MDGIKENHCCDICNNPYRIGVDEFIWENKYGILVVNSSNIVMAKNKAFEASKRFSFAVFEHEKNIPNSKCDVIKKDISMFLQERYGYSQGDYEFIKAMNKIKGHWHIHICIYPFFDLAIGGRETRFKNTEYDTVFSGDI